MAPADPARRSRCGAPACRDLPPRRSPRRTPPRSHRLRPPTCHTPNGRLEQLPRRRREMGDIRRRGALVVDDADLVPFARQVEHRRTKFVPGRPEETRAPHDPRPLARSALAVHLRAPVRRQRVRRIGLDVRLGFAVEHVVGREVHERCAELLDMAGAADVDRRRLLRVGLGAVDVGPGGRVQHEPERLSQSGDGSVTSQSAWLNATASANSSASARPSWPPAPVIRTRSCPVPTGSAMSCSRDRRREDRSTATDARRGRQGRTPPWCGRA